MSTAGKPSGRRSKPSAKEDTRFPAFEVPEGTPMISASQVQRALDEDGIGDIENIARGVTRHDMDSIRKSIARGIVKERDL